MEYDPSIVIVDCPEVYPVEEDSILLVKCLDISPGQRVLEVGCGSGVVSLHCAKAGAEVTAVDLNPHAVTCTRRNMEANSLSMSVSQSDMYSDVEGRFDVIIFNLPYLPVDEPGTLEMAWSGGPTGVDPLIRLLDGKGHLLPDGRFVVVVSSLMDQDALESATSGFKRRELGRLPLFFEVLSVIELRPR